jgi:hypothetical protein
MADAAPAVLITGAYLAPVLLTRLLVPLLTASAPARILNVGSIGQVAFDPAEAGFEHGYSQLIGAAASDPSQRLWHQS